MLFIANATLYPMAADMPEVVEQGCLAAEGGRIMRVGTGFTYADIWAQM